MDKLASDSSIRPRGARQEWRLLPRRLSDPELEDRFLDEFRSEGLRSTAYAACVGIAGYLLIWAIDLHFNGWSGAAALRRIIVVGLLCVIVSLVLLQPARLLRNYSVALGSLVLAAHVGSVTVTHLFRDDDPTLYVNPTSLLGLWIIYGFVRLPLKVSIPICIAGSVCALFGSRVTNLHDPTVRTGVYLIIANLLGITHSRSVEVRERELFLQRRILEQAEADVRDRSHIAELASAEKTRLIAAVGHDLRQPMMAAGLHLSVLARRLEARDTDGSLVQIGRVLESMKMLGDTLEHLLLAARHEAGAMSVRTKAVPIRQLFGRLVDICESYRQGRTELLVRETKGELIVLTDEQILFLALVNLVTNALKFGDESKPRPRVVVRAHARDGVCRIVVVDNGIGMSPEDLERIWQPFFQIGNDERNREKGIGLGLYLVSRSIMKVDRHEVAVRSNLGRGSFFTLTLPLSDAVVQEGALGGCEVRDASRINGASLGGMYVLIIEDDPMARASLEELLSEWGVLSSSGATLHDAMLSSDASDRIVDAVLVDFRLSGAVRGDQVIEEVRGRLGYEMDAVLMTAEVEQASELSSCLPSRTSLLLKPFESEALHGLLASALANALSSEGSS